MSHQVPASKTLRDNELVLNDNDQVIARENWQTGLQRYLAYCEENRIVPKDLTSFSG